MNRYEKKKNIMQTLLEIEDIKCMFSIILFIIGPLLLGLLIFKIPHILNVIAPMMIFKNTAEYFVLAYMIGWMVIGIVYLGYLCVLIVAKIIKSIITSLYAARIMQYLPLSAEDWGQLGAKTDEEAIHILRDLVKKVGYRNDLENCEELRDQIAESYRAFLIFKYGKDYTVTLNNASFLVLCPDEEFDELLQSAYDNYNDEKRLFPNLIY